MEDSRQVDGSLWYYPPNKGAPIFSPSQDRSSWLPAVQSLQEREAHLALRILRFSYSLSVSSSEPSGPLTRTILPSISSAYVCAMRRRTDQAHERNSPLYKLGSYHVLGRILCFVPYHSPLHPGRVLTTFGAISLVIEVLNGIGASYVAVRTLSPEVQRTGSLFVALAATFQARYRRGGGGSSSTTLSPRVHQPLLTLYGSSALIITARCVYRTLEYLLRRARLRRPHRSSATSGSSTPLRGRPDAGRPTARCCSTPATPAAAYVYLTREDGVTEVAGPGYRDSLLDPFDLCGMVKGKKKTTRFWDGDGDGARAAKERLVREPPVGSTRAHEGV
ncbi:RTA1 like protein-domain-containing protein [Biscogniauxia mediterranea]|nr:RTA1 like protein-domain-containing protein [Biscogniauxia mediterranea]